MASADAEGRIHLGTVTEHSTKTGLKWGVVGGVALGVLLPAVDPGRRGRCRRPRGRDRQGPQRGPSVEASRDELEGVLAPNTSGVIALVEDTAVVAIQEALAKADRDRDQGDRQGGRRRDRPRCRGRQGVAGLLAAASPTTGGGSTDGRQGRLHRCRWTHLPKGITGSAMLVSLSDRDFTDTFGEVGALTKYLQGQQVAGWTELIREAREARGTGFGVTTGPDKMRAETMASLESGLAALAAKAPDEVEAYRQLVLGTSQAVADAKGGVVPVEGLDARGDREGPGRRLTAPDAGRSGPRYDGASPLADMKRPPLRDALRGSCSSSWEIALPGDQKRRRPGVTRQRRRRPWRPARARASKRRRRRRRPWRPATDREVTAAVTTAALPESEMLGAA